MIILLSIVLFLCFFSFFYLRLPKFGATAKGAAKKRIQDSPQFRHGKFQNQNETPQLTEGHKMSDVLWKFLFGSRKNTKPPVSLPSAKTDLHTLDPNENILVWFGHSSYFFQLDGKRFLVDPVFSGSASPLPGSNTAFKGSDVYTVADLPDIDFLIITHDHYDHLDYKTVWEVRPKVKKVICGLGVTAHLLRWGYKAYDITDMDWHETHTLESGFTIHTCPARHFSGRRFTRNQSLWLSYVLQTPSMKIFIGGDSGYDTHFTAIGTQYGPFDLAILECGQYDDAWKYIHLHPEEVIIAGKDLQAKAVLPVHAFKFAMANHSWREPFDRLFAANETHQFPLITPLIGEKVLLQHPVFATSKWWDQITPQYTIHHTNNRE